MSRDTYRGEDSTYHSRHSLRSTRRAKRIIEAIREGDKVLDVGCNRGVVSTKILENTSSLSVTVTGIEINRSTVSPDLLQSKSFEFIEGDVSEIVLTEKYDVVFYGAVHHHIVRDKGLGVAVKTFRDLVDSCNRTLYFETGHLSEGPRWLWQNKIGSFFSSDEEHIFYLLRSVESRLLNVSVAGKFYIHGVPRWLIRLDLIEERESVDPEIEIDLGYTRSFGSKSQKLVEKNIFLGSFDSPVEFGCYEECGQRYFVKRYCYDKTPQILEFHLANIAPAWAVKPIGSVSPSQYLLFPFVQGLSLWDARSLDRSCRNNLGNQLIGVIRSSEKTETSSIKWSGLLLPLKIDCRLIDVIDLNLNNFIVSICESGDYRVNVVDFEPHSAYNRYRNYKHLSDALKILDVFPMKRFQFKSVYFIGLLVQLARFQFQPDRIRIISRHPRLGGLLLIKFRNLIEGAMLKLLPKFKEF